MLLSDLYMMISSELMCQAVIYALDFEFNNRERISIFRFNWQAIFDKCSTSRELAIESKAWVVQEGVSEWASEAEDLVNVATLPKRKWMYW